MKIILKFSILLFLLLIYTFIIKKPSNYSYNINILNQNNNHLIDNFNKHNNNYWNMADQGYNPNNELQYYTPNNIIFRDDKIIISAKNNYYNNHDYTSGMITTKDKFEFTYGTIIFKAKAATGDGLLSAVWLLPANDESFPEFDLIEILGEKPNQVWTGMHYLKNDLKEKYFTINKISNDFFTYEFKWTKDYIECYINNKLIYKTTDNIPHEKMYLIINLAVGGDWPTNVDNSILPSSFILDYLFIITEEQT